MRDEAKAGAASVGLSSLGVLTGGVAGVGFLVTPIDVPLWFVLAAVALPTGDVLAVLRGMVTKRIPVKKQGGKQ